MSIVHLIVVVSLSLIGVEIAVDEPRARTVASLTAPIKAESASYSLEALRVTTRIEAERCPDRNAGSPAIAAALAIRAPGKPPRLLRPDEVAS